MYLDKAQTCPWISVLSSDVIQKLTKEDQVISLIKMLVGVTLQAIQIYETGQFAHLDALVGNYGCETHAFNVLSLANSEELKEECQSLLKTCVKIMEYVNSRQHLKGKLRSLDEFKNQIQKICLISERMKYWGCLGRPCC